MSRGRIPRKRARARKGGPARALPRALPWILAGAVLLLQQAAIMRTNSQLQELRAVNRTIEARQDNVEQELGNGIAEMKRSTRELIQELRTFLLDKKGDPDDGN